jgi:hypothetical protein
MASISCSVCYSLCPAFLTHGHGTLLYQLVVQMSVASVDLSMFLDQMPTTVVVFIDPCQL